MGSAASASRSDEGGEPPLNLQQEVISWQDVPLVNRRTGERSTQLTAPERVVTVKNPFVIELESTRISSENKLDVAYSAPSSDVELAVYKHAAPSGLKLSECSIPEEVAADWDLISVNHLRQTISSSFSDDRSGDSKSQGPPKRQPSDSTAVPPLKRELVEKSIELPQQMMNSEEHTGFILLLHATPRLGLAGLAQSRRSGGDGSQQPGAKDAAMDWVQWYFLRMEPLSSRRGYYVAESSEKMKCGKQTYNILKIFTDRSGPDSDALCLICQTDPANTMVLPCRHMCLCRQCADSIRLQTPKCPICRGDVKSLVLINRPRSQDFNPS